MRVCVRACVRACVRVCVCDKAYYSLQEEVLKNPSRSGHTFYKIPTVTLRSVVVPQSRLITGEECNTAQLIAQITRVLHVVAVVVGIQVNHFVSIGNHGWVGAQHSCRHR